MIFLSAFCVFCRAAYNKTSVFVPIKPTEVASSNAYIINVRALGDTVWQVVPLYDAKVQEINATSGRARTLSTSVAYFDFDGTVELSITPNTTLFPTIDIAVVRPYSYGIEPSILNNTISFKISQPHNNVVLQLNDDIFNVVHFWTNTIEENPITEAQALNDSSIIYYGPGYHSLSSGKGNITLASGQTLYLAAGAVVQAGVNIQNVSDVTVRGHGILLNSPEHSILIEYSRNVLIDSVSVINPAHYSINTAVSKGVHIRKFRGISGVQWGDGLDVFCSQDVLIEGVFMRTSDDSIALYQHRWDYSGNSSNITVRDSSLWADVAHPINMGTHGNSINPETADGITLSNIDILDQREPQLDYQGTIAFSIGDENLYQNILIENIRVEDFRWGMLLSMRVMYNPKYNLAPGRGIKNVTIKNLSWTRSNKNIVNTALISGYSPDRSIDFVDFQGLNINGQHIWDNMTKPAWYVTSDLVPMAVTGNVNNLTFST